MHLKYPSFSVILLVLVFLLPSLHVNAQKNTEKYTSQWKKVDDFKEKGLTRSALGEVEGIYRLAKKGGNDPQVIKALLYKMILQEGLQEDASVNSIDSAEREIALAGEPARSILESITAQLYWNYFRQNRYKLYQRTRTVNFTKTDIATWTADDLNKKIGELYLSSLKAEDLLKQTGLDEYDAIISRGNVRNLRPTLFDLLAHRALDYFKNDERDITRPAYAFEIDDPVAFAPDSEFIHQQFATKDSGSLHQKALVIFQQLLAFHEKDNVPDALIDADIERILFVNQYAVMQDKDEYYIAALQQISRQFGDFPSSAQAGFLEGQFVYNASVEAQRQNRQDSIHTVRKARAILDAIAAKYPSSEGGINARNLISQISRREISLTAEKVNVPRQAFRALVTYRNSDRAYLRIVALTPELRRYLNQHPDDNEVINRLTAERSIRSWQQDLPETDDYLSHSVEIKVDGLPVGEYALLGSSDEPFSLAHNPVAAQFFYVSNISFVNEGLQYFVLDRTTGQPLPDVTVRVWNRKYDNTARGYHLAKGELLATDKNGYFMLKEPKKNADDRNIRLDLTRKDDRLFLDFDQYVYFNNYNEAAGMDTGYRNQREYDKANARVFLFTDRSIYRPGQVVYFKGIGITKDWKTKQPKLLSLPDSVTVYLYDANYQKSDSARLLLNDFGSFNGKFKIPESKLNGGFQIRDGYSNSSVSFSVEEYKRPNFYTGFDTASGSYRVNDTVTVSGFAKAYAGNPIDGAKVSYRVTRVARFLYPWMFWKRGFPQVQPVEIAHGEMTTGTDGKFRVRFAAKPDPGIDRNTDPVFDYKIEADVTDLTGETRSGDITVPVGYQSVDLQIGLPSGEITDIDSLENIRVTSKNLSGEFQSVPAHIRIYKLQVPDRLIRARLWPQPDLFIFNKNEYTGYFPHDEYKDEARKESWAKGALVFEKQDSTRPVDTWPLEKKDFQAGWYVAEATAKDPYGGEVRDVKYFQVYDKRSGELPAPAYSWNYAPKDIAAPGETATLVTGTTAGKVFLIREIDGRGTPAGNLPSSGKDSSRFQFVSLGNEMKTFSFHIKESDRGGFGVHTFFVKDNRFYTATNTIYVPWNNKALTVSFDTYRDKTLPGSGEKWKVKITGYKGEKVAAEMMASMYDASLDQFRPHGWDKPAPWPVYQGYNAWQPGQNFTTGISMENYRDEPLIPQVEKLYDALKFLPAYRSYTSMVIRGMASNADMLVDPSMKREKGLQVNPSARNEAPMPISDSAQTAVQNGVPQPAAPPEVQIRKNFNETAFFFPELRTDKEGTVEFSFTMPEALTRWKLMALAHTKDLAFGYGEKTVITHKDLMVQPNAPRFLRQGDTMEFSAKIVNAGENEISGQAELQLFAASTMTPVDDLFKNSSPVQKFSAGAAQSTLLNFSIDIPENFNDAVVYRIVAKAGNVSDGQEAAIPVVTNRMLVTETMPLPVRGEGTKDFNFEKLSHETDSKTLTNYGLTVEYTANPGWYAVQALPYLMEYPYECAEQSFNRYYANALAQKIVNSAPKIKAIMERWSMADTTALKSNLQKDEELKSVLLEETPWVLQAQNEAQQKRNIALLFNMTKMGLQAQAAIRKLGDMQSPDGGFAWFRGGPGNRYITQYIVTGIGHLEKLNALPSSQQDDIQAILRKAIPYLDARLKEDYDNLVKSKVRLKENNLSPLVVQYLYMRSFFPEFPVTASAQTAYRYYRGQAKKYWLSQGIYLQGMIALSLHRSGDDTVAQAIMKSLKQNAIRNKELGMYWKAWDQRGYRWEQAPVESQALLIEAFSEIEKDAGTIDELRTWLLKNKQTNNWKTTKATAEACYALLLQGTDWLGGEKTVVIQLGSRVISSASEKNEAGTGYFKSQVDGSEVKPDMGHIQVTVSANPGSSSGQAQRASSSWGAVYWQYFENLDKITFSETPLKLSKKLFTEKNSDNGPVLVPVNDGDQLHIGDKIKVRIELRVDRDMEYVHMKDMRASCMEPTQVISQYKYQDGLGYYESTKDVSTHFFFGNLPRGTYVFEYPLFVTHAGNFSNGITTIQCMYAPEFTAHSEGVRVHVR